MAPIVLPDRPLKLSRHARPGYWGLFIASIILLALGTFLLLWQLPGVQRDWKISRNPVIVSDGYVQDGKCETRKGFFTDCEAHLSYMVDGTQYETDVTLMFVDFHSGDYTVEIVRSGDDPSLATMDIGLDKLWNRLIMLGLFLLLFLGGGLFTFWQASQNMRASGQLARRGRMEAIPVTIAAITAAGRNTNVVIRDPAGRRPKAKFTSRFGKKEVPLLLETPDGGTVGVAVRHEGSPVPVLLDRELKRLDLTEAERTAALAAL